MTELDRLREELKHAREANKAAEAAFDAAIQDESLTMPSVRKATLALRADDIFQAEQRLVASQAAFDDAAIRALFDHVKYDPCEPVVSDGVEALRSLMGRAAMLLSGFANMHTELTGNGTIERLNAALKEIDE